MDVAEKVVTVQRDFGDRTDRKHARFKYTIEDRGLDAFRAEVERRAGVKLGAARAVHVHSTGDRYGWSEGDDGRGHLTLFVAERPRARRRGCSAADSRCARSRKCTTATSASRRTRTSIIANVPAEQQAEIERIARESGLLAPWSALRRNSMACVALPTCGLALAESERYLPDLLTALEERLEAHGLPPTTSSSA